MGSSVSKTAILPNSRPDLSRISVASSRRSVSHGAVQKTARQKIKKKARREEARERLWENLTEGHSAHL